MRIFNKLKLYRINHTFTRLGFWYIPSISISLLLFLFLVWAEPDQKAATFITPAANLNSTKKVAIPQTQKQQVFQKLVTASPSVSATYSPKTADPSKQKSQALQKAGIEPQKHLRTKNAPIAKPKVEPRYTAPAIEIRVAVALGAKELAIASSTPANIFDSAGELMQQLPAGLEFQVQTTNSTMTLGNWQLPPLVWVEATKGGAVYVGDRAYRGRLLLVSQENTLLAINYVDMEQYLASVVGSEISASAPIEALKAQAVAARSYALVHLSRPASSLYDLGASERWQAYKGLNTEYNTTHQAVSETAGQVLFYQGGIVD